jgi:hypothetical protein
MVLLSILWSLVVVVEEEELLLPAMLVLEAVVQVVIELEPEYL